MKLRSFYFLAVFAGLVSCSNDELTSSTPLLTISTAPRSIGNEGWIFLTREDGTLIEAKELTDDGDGFVFERPSDFTDERFVVHELIHEPNSREFYVNSYTAITGGKIHYTGGTAGIGLTEVGKHNYSFTNVPVGYSPWITGLKVITNTGSGTNGTFSGTTTLGANNTDLLFWFQNNDNPLVVPKYTLAENVSAGQTLSMSFNDLIPASEQTITFGEQQDYTVVFIGPASPELPLPAYSLLTWRNATEIKLYHPGGAFDEYSTFIETRAGNDYQQYVTTGSIPTSFKSMPATINSFSQAATSFTITTSGAYDYLIVSAYNRWNDNALQYTLSRTVYMDDTSTKTFTIPDLPEVIIARYPELSTAPPTGFNSIELRDHSSVDNYPDFITKLWGKEPFPNNREFLMRTKLLTE